MIVQRVLGEAFRTLPRALQEFHAGTNRVAYQGVADVRRGAFLASLACDLGGFPAQSEGLPLRMAIRAGEGFEKWDRDFGGHRLVSVLRQLDPAHVIERFGPFEAIMRPRVVQGTLEMPVVGMRVRGLRCRLFW